MKLLVDKNVNTTHDNGEIILLNMKNGKFYGLDNLGTEVWDLIVKGLTFNQIIEYLSKIYDVNLNELNSDILNLIDNLLKYGLVKKDE